MVVAMVVLEHTLSGCGGSTSVPPTDGASFRVQVAKAVQAGFSSKKAGQQSVGTLAPKPRNPQSFYRDDYGLWAVDVEGGVDYYVDESLKVLGGTERFTYQGEGSNFDSTLTVALSSGKLAGFRQVRRKGIRDGVFTFSEVTESPKEGNSSSSGSWKDGVGEFRQTYPGSDGLPRTNVTKFQGDGRIEVSYQNESQFTYTLRFEPDSSGAGEVTGDNAALPAQIVWDATGNGTITFADGVRLTFTGYQFNQI